jgi:hypothetical protein
MKAALLATALIAACYGPTAPAGAPCAPAGAGSRCPSGQTCVVQGGVELCQLGGVADASPDGQVDAPAAAVPDAPPDAANPDLDGDGVLNAADNCPTVANADQGNEDGDAWGDACDLCPPFASAVAADADGDGVGDACDPNPTTAGDRMVVFEGFHHGIPAGWTKAGNGSWSAVGDDVAISVGSGTNGALVIQPPPSLPGGYTVTTSSTATTLKSPPNSVGVVGGSVPTQTGILCAQVSANGTGSTTSLVDLAAGSYLASAASTWTLNEPLVASLTRVSATSYHGQVVEAGHTSAVTADLALTTTDVALRARAVDARFSWVMVVASP